MIIAELYRIETYSSIIEDALLDLAQYIPCSLVERLSGSESLCVKAIFSIDSSLRALSLIEHSN